MCGRIFCLFRDPQELYDAVVEAGCEAVLDPNFHYKGPNYNTCPTQNIPVLDSNLMLTMRPWSFRIGSLSVVNARCEGIDEKPTFRNIIDHERCIAISSGYYEWRESKSKTGKKEAFAFRPRDHKVCFMAALRHPGSGSVVLMTREACASISHIHTRMPVLLRTDSIKDWLNPAVIFRELEQELVDLEDYSGYRKGFKDSLAIDYETLAPYVNSINNKGPECLKSLKDHKEESFRNGIGKFFPKKRKDPTETEK